MLMKDKNKCLTPSPAFIYDEGCLNIINLSNETVTVFGQYAECEGCSFQNLTSLNPGANTSLLVDTKYALQMYYVGENKTELCRWTNGLLEHYRYEWKISDVCSPIDIKVPAENAYLPILTAFIILFFFGTIWYMVKCIYKCTQNRDHWRRFIFWSTDEQSQTNVSSQEGVPLINVKHPNRLKSLDVFRGLCIIVMIFVNYGGGQYWFFKHSVWNGLTFADLVFPWFLWIMGMSFYMSIHDKLRRAVPRRYLVFQILRRSLVLVILGLIINSHGKATDLTTIRFPGVLQRIGITYLIVGLLETACLKRVNTEEGRWILVKDIFVAWPQWLFMGSLLILHTAITYGVYVPNCGRGYVGPGGLHQNGSHYNCTGGVAGYIDRKIFGSHIYQYPTCKKLYETTVPFDPEGFLGILTSTVLVYFGVQAGRILKTYPNVKEKLYRWIIWGITLGLIGGILCGFSKNSGPVPINKNLWSMSFIFALGGLAFLIQAFLIWIVDIQRKWGGRPCFYPGMNPLFVYIGSELLRDTFPFGWKLQVETHGNYLAMNLWGTALWVALAIFLYKRNIFVSI